MFLPNTDFSSLLSSVYSVEYCIQFTFEVENENSLSFPSILVSKCIDQFSVIVFRKPFSSYSNNLLQKEMTAF